MTKDHFAIGQVAAAASVHIETIRYYQHLGIVAEPLRPPGGIRRDNSAAIARLRLIKRVQALGFSLDEVRNLLTFEGGKSCRKTRLMPGMTEMEMPLPDNTAPMMAVVGPFELLAMGGMFSVLKVRRDQKPGAYKDHGWFKQPPGTTAYEWTGSIGEPVGAKSEAQASMPRSDKNNKVDVPVRRPMGHTKY